MATGASNSNGGFADAFIVPSQLVSDGFLSRATGFGPNRTAACRALIDGLASDGVWEKLDAFYIYSSLDQTNAVLNLVEPRYTATKHGSPAFTVDQGFTGVDLSTTVYLDSGFAPSTAAANFLQDAAHIGVYVNNNAIGHSGGAVAIGFSEDGVYHTDIAPRFEDGTSILRVNGNPGVVTSSSDSTGHWVATRTDSLTTVAYRNGSSLGSHSASSSGNPTLSIFTLARNSTGPSSDFAGGPYQIAIAHMGGALTGTDVTNLYSRINTFVGLLPFGSDLGVTTITCDAICRVEDVGTDITGVGQRTIWWRPN
jgi:hypothetical protein